MIACRIGLSSFWDYLLLHAECGGCIQTLLWRLFLMFLLACCCYFFHHGFVPHFHPFWWLMLLTASVMSCSQCHHLSHIADFLQSMFSRKKQTITNRGTASLKMNATKYQCHNQSKIHFAEISATNPFPHSALFCKYDFWNWYVLCLWDGGS